MYYIYMTRSILIFLYKHLSRFFGNKLGFNKSLLMRKISKHLYHYIQKDYADILGFRFYVDDKDSLGLTTFGCYEQFELEIVFKHLKKGSIVADVGANIGYHSLLLSHHVGRNGKIYSFEPDNANFVLLNKNIAVNRISNVEAHQLAVADKNCDLRLYLSEVNRADHVIFPTKEHKLYNEVKAVSLDNFFSGSNRHVDYVKVDIQGAENTALKGMHKIIKNNPNLFLTMEFWPEGLKRAGTKPDQFINHILSLGFKLYNISERKKLFYPVQPNELISFFDNNPSGYTNLLCKKNT